MGFIGGTRFPGNRNNDDANASIKLIADPESSELLTSKPPTGFFGLFT